MCQNTGGIIMGNVFLATITALSLGITTAVAAGSNAGCHYIDADGNGVCDYAGNACSYVDADGDGICDYAGNACSYVDADGDGVCDNYQERCGNGPASAGTNSAGAVSEASYDNSRAGRGYGNGSRGGAGRYYVDADGDGVCDNYASGRSRGCGNGFRGGCGR